MALQSGLDNYFAWKKEVTWGTAVAPDKYAPFTSQTLTDGINFEPIVSDAIIAGNLARSTSLVAEGATTISGNVTMDLPREGCAELLEFCFGTDVTTGSDPYTHTYAMAETLPSFTCGIGMTDYSGTVRDFRFEGCKVTDFSLSCAVGGNVVLDMTIVAETVATTTALTPSYSSVEFFRYTAAPFTIDGGAICVEDFTLNWSNGLSSRTCLGQATIDEPYRTSLGTGTVTATGMFENLDEYADFAAYTTKAMVLTATEGTDVLTVTVQGQYRSGTAPSMNGTDYVQQVYTLDLLGDDADSDAALAVILVNNEA